MSWHCRLSQIGKNKSVKRTDRGDDQPPSSAADDRQQRVRGQADADLDDSIPF